MKTVYKTGVIHGRFQILHHDHLRYILAGKALCDHIVIGITNPDPFLTKDEIADPARSNPLANPLTYYERYLLVKAALTETGGLTSQQFSIVPLPINMPERYQYYVPLDAVFFLTIYDDWGRQKQRYFQSLGLKCHVLWEVSQEEKGISATDIRNRMIQDESWEDMVPQEVASLLKIWHIPERLKKIIDNCQLTIVSGACPPFYNLGFST